MRLQHRMLHDFQQRQSIDPYVTLVLSLLLVALNPLGILPALWIPSLN